MGAGRREARALPQKVDQEGHSHVSMTAGSLAVPPKGRDRGADGPLLRVHTSRVKHIMQKLVHTVQVWN